MIDDNRSKSIKIDHVKGHNIFHHRLVIDFQYQSINWHRLLSIDIDYHRLSISSIRHAGNNSWPGCQRKFRVVF